MSMREKVRRRIHEKVVGRKAVRKKEGKGGREIIDVSKRIGRQRP